MRKNNTLRVLLLTVMSCQLFLSGCGNNRELIRLEELSEPETVEDMLSEEDKCGQLPEVQEAKQYVYICGAVNCPGVYEVSANARVYEAVTLAGGCTAEAAMEAVNQARVLADGEQLRIPTKQEMELAGTSQTQPVVEDVGGQSASKGINLNTASAEELVTLKGIGTSRAQAIIAYREEHGGFKDTEELMNISGIGERTYQKLKEEICVR